VTEETAQAELEAEPIEPEGPDEKRVEDLDAETLERRRHALANVRKFGDPVLRSPASPVEGFGPELAAEVERMVALMHDALGVGLAATQLGLMRRLLVFQAGPDATPTALVNPEIEWWSDEMETAEEGCLSLPGIVIPVSRSPAMIERSIGAAPRQRGSSDGWTFRSSSSSRSGALISCPNAHTAPTSGSARRTRSTASGSLTLATWSRSIPSSRAASAAGGEARRRPRPRGRSGGVTTRTGRCGESASRRSTVAAKPEVPR
jgi:hypothetical protein